MVATRGGARTGQTEEPPAKDTSQTLRKKPVRRATAKTAPQTRATRSKNADTNEDATVQEEVEQIPEKHEPQPRPATTRATRSKRGETVEPEPSETIAIATKPARAAPQPKRVTRTRSVKKDEVSQEPEARKATSTTSKPALAARPTRQTRANVPAAQAPLSPKKITQVSKARTRSAKAGQDEKQKPAPATRAASLTQNSRRKRTVSDENAEVPELKPTRSTTLGQQSREDAAKPAKSKSVSKPPQAKEQEVEEDTPLTSGETTPADSPGPAFQQPKDYSEDNLDAQALEQSDQETDAGNISASDDELCGPKTPMRRSQRNAARYYTSENQQKKKLDPDVPMHTPPRRYGADGASRPTPQTQKPHYQAAIPDSATRPMTVARGSDRAMVFRPLEESDEGTPRPPVLEDAKDASDKEEIAPDVGDVGEAEPPSSKQEDEAADVDFEDSEVVADVGASGVAQVDADETIILSDDHSDHDDDDHDGNDNDESEVYDSPTAQPSVASYEAEESMVDVDESSFMEPPVASHEAEESTMELDPPVAEQATSSDEMDEDDSVIVHSMQEDDSEEDEGQDLTMFGLKTPRPQTIPWNNIREDHTIPVDFDSHFANVRSSPTHAEAQLSYGPIAEPPSPQMDEANIDFGFDEEVNAYAPDATMTLNDFIDVAALAEPTLQFDAVSGPQDTNSDISQGEPSAQSPAENDDTVIITRNESPEVDPSTPVLENERSSIGDVSLGSSPSRKLRESLKQLSPRRMQLAQGITTPLKDHSEAVEEVDADSIPHYALPTLSSRRKSLPAISDQTPVRSSSRPNTSDGASATKTNMIDHPWSVRSRHSFLVEPLGEMTPSRVNGTPSKMGASKLMGKTGLSKSAAQTPVATPGERYPRNPPREAYGGQAQTIGAPKRFHTPGRSPARYPATVQKMPSQPSQRKPSTPSASSMPLRLRTPTSATAQRSTASEKNKATTPVATPQERFPRRSARQTYNEHASTVAAPARFHTPIQGRPKRPATAQKLASQRPCHSAGKQQEAKLGPAPEEDAEPETPKAATTSTKPSPAVTPQARYPRLPARQAYDEHVSTVAVPSRFRSPAPASPKRPATTQKPVNLRKVTLKAAAPDGPHTPIKTPLKPAAMTPSQVPMTPHPGAPLRGVVALVEVFTLDGASASAPFISLLQRLGAKTTKSWSERVTHVIFKDGSPTTLQRVRLNNKEVEKSGNGFVIHCVNSRWVSDCDASGARVDETDDAYAVDVTDVPRGGHRRRKSMEPSALVNVGGNVVRNSKSSAGRSSMGRASLGRSSMKLPSSAEKDHDEKEDESYPPFTPVAKFTGVEDDFDFEEEQSELSTPDYLAAPDKLVQMTAPANRVRKLDLKNDGGKNRRLTSWNPDA